MAFATPRALARVSARLLPLMFAFAIARPAAAPAATTQSAAVTEQIRAIKKIEIDMMREGTKKKFAEARAEAREAREAAEEARRAKRHGGRGTRARLAGNRAKPAPPEEEAPPIETWERRQSSPSGVQAILSVPTNVKANNSAGDAANATQSEEMVAAWNNCVFIAWNDGQGSNTGGAYQGYSYSSDGGATFTDGGDPPKPAGYPSFRWMSDPVVTVNEKTGEFYYCGLANTDATHNSIAVARGHFSGASFVWDNTVIVRNAISSSQFLDKQWMAADSSGSGTNVYISNSTFTTTGDQIDFYRSTDGGDTWSAATTLSSPGDYGYVQGSRVVVGPSGEVYAVWNAVGQATAEDFFRVRKSTNGGTTFGAETTIPGGYIANFGTGAPGFNRERGIHFPSVAVDRTSGANRGRLYVTWNESYNHQDDLFPTPSAGNVKVEVENNDQPSTATPFTPGQVLRGTTSSVNPADLDYWSFNLTAGQHIIVWADSFPASQTYTLRIFAPNPDATQRLAFGGDVSAGTSVSQAYYTYTAPVTGTYYLRFANAFTTTDSKVGGYRVRTLLGTRGSERGRDQRDVFLSWTDNGTTWSTPVQVNDDAVGFDDYLPEVTVGSDGRPYVHWFDFRDDVYGSRSNAYMSRSNDGGATWDPAQRISSVTSNWTTTLSNLAPNMGDYSHSWSDAKWVHPIWADGRDGSADVYTTRIAVDHDITACAPNGPATAGQTVNLSWTVSNPNEVFGNTFTVTLVDQRGWPLPSPSPLVLAAGASGPVNLSVSVPDTAATGQNVLTLAVQNARGSIVRTCNTTLDVTGGQLAAGSQGAVSFALKPSVPNPARGAVRIDYTLPREGGVTLRIYGLHGEVVRTLESGTRGAGVHTVTWNGLDDRGHAVQAGTYFYRLEGLGQTATRRLVWMM